MEKFPTPQIHDPEKELSERFEKEPSNKERLKLLLGFLDSLLFPENPLEILSSNFQEKKLAQAMHYFDVDIDGKLENHSYRINETINQKEYGVDALLQIAIHEVRHRVQHEKKVAMLSQGDILKLDQIDLPEKTRKLLNGRQPSEVLKSNIPENLSPNDFDAVLTEKISFFLSKTTSLSEVAKSVIDKDSADILSYLIKKLP